jgi:hypothetical protein
MFLKKIGIIVLFLFFALNFVYAATILDENFNDNDFTNNPSWINEFSNAIIISNILHSDGLIVDQSDRYVSKFSLPVNVDTSKCDLILSYDALLKSNGSPQNGRGVHISYYDTNSPYTYLLSVTNGYTNGASYDHHSLLLGYTHPDTAGNIIKTPYAPSFDRWYNIKAIRHDHIWKLYVNNNLIGIENDTLNINKFNNIILDMTGSVAVDNIKIETENCSENQIPEFTTVGAASLLALACLFVFLKKR